MSKLLFIGLYLAAIVISPTWLLDPNEAFQKAKSGHRLVLINFSGSDWCGPCVRMHTEIFEASRFKALAEDHLILVGADFPRQRKNKLSPLQQERNNQLAEKYNPQGIFPYTLLLDCDGKVVRYWEGFPKGGADAFDEDLLNAIKQKP